MTQFFTISITILSRWGYELDTWELHLERASTPCVKAERHFDDTFKDPRSKYTKCIHILFNLSYHKNSLTKVPKRGIKRILLFFLYCCFWHLLGWMEFFIKTYPYLVIFITMLSVWALYRCQKLKRKNLSIFLFYILIWPDILPLLLNVLKWKLYWIEKNLYLLNVCCCLVSLI
jgi:hypothetical protein